MEEILGDIYCWFESLYGKPLSEYLWGYDCQTEAYDADLLYNQFGLIAIATAVFVPIIYYYWWNPVRRQQLRYWGLMAAAGALNGVVAYWRLSGHLEDGLIGDCLLYNGEGGQVIGGMNIVMFGVADFIVTCGYFFIASIIMKRGSKAVRHYPF